MLQTIFLGSLFLVENKCQAGFSMEAAEKVSWDLATKGKIISDFEHCKKMQSNYY